MNKILVSLFVGALLGLHELNAAPPTLLDLRREIDNHEAEIHIFEERLHTQENIIDDLRQQLSDSLQTQRDANKSFKDSIETRLAGLENSLANVIADLRLLQTHANDSTKAMAQYKQKQIDSNKNIESLHEGLASLLKALQADVPESGNTYTVQRGDSLEKIARKNGTSIKKIKDLNNLSNDRIIIGQVLKVSQ